MSAFGGRYALRGHSLLLATVIGEICCVLSTGGNHAVFVGAEDVRAPSHRPNFIDDPCGHALFEPSLYRLIFDEAVGEAKFGAVTLNAKANVADDADRAELKFGVGYFEFKHFRTMRKAPDIDRRENKRGRF